MSTLASKHAPADRRGRALGVVTAGISAGILAGRMLGGALTDVMGWRAMLAVLAGVCLICAGVGRALLPGRVERAPGSWLSGLLSTPDLLRTHPGLLFTASAGALWFFAFSLIWVGVSLALSMPPHELSPTAVGLYSLAGLSGMAATPFAGRLADRFGSRRIVLAGLLMALACVMAMWPALSLPPLLLLALALFDAGLFGAQVANQRRVLSMDPLRPGQLNSSYMVIYFIGGSLGAATGGPLVSTFGWPAAVGVAGLAITFALALYAGRPVPAES
jgi:predicted MFS family arabinose efflux permease